MLAIRGQFLAYVVGDPRGPRFLDSRKRCSEGTQPGMCTRRLMTASSTLPLMKPLTSASVVQASTDPAASQEEAQVACKSFKPTHRLAPEQMSPRALPSTREYGPLLLSDNGVESCNVRASFKFKVVQAFLRLAQTHLKRSVQPYYATADDFSSSPRSKLRPSARRSPPVSSSCCRSA